MKFFQYLSLTPAPRSLLLRLLFLGIFGPCLFTSTAQALYSFQTTLSSGYYRTVDQKPHHPVLFYWDFRHTSASETETYVDMGASNWLISNSWKIQLYQANVTIPLQKNSDLPAHRRPQVTVGRQLLTEGFELSSIDGAQLPYNWSSSSGVLLYGGMLRDLQDQSLRRDVQIFGGSTYGQIEGVRYRTGYLHKENSALALNLAHGSLAKTWDHLPWTPMTVVKGQWNLRNGSLDQALADLEVSPSPTWMGSLTYSSLQPTALDAGNSLFIYRLFAVSTQERIGGNTTWIVTPSVRAEGGVQRVSYRSLAGPEVSYEENLGLHFSRDTETWSPSIVHVKSYGGRVVQAGLRYVRFLNGLTHLRIEADMARIEKMNGFSGWAYHGRGGLSFHLGSQFMALALLELERNPIFKIDSRVVAYVSHFLY